MFLNLTQQQWVYLLHAWLNDSHQIKNLHSYTVYTVDVTILKLFARQPLPNTSHSNTEISGCLKLEHEMPVISVEQSIVSRLSTC